MPLSVSPQEPPPRLALGAGVRVVLFALLGAANMSGCSGRADPERGLGSGAGAVGVAGATVLATDAELVLSARLEPIDGEVEIASQLTASILTVHVREGDRVEKGAVLFELDAPRERADVEAARRSVLLAEARLKRVEAGVGEEEKEAVEARRKSTAADLAFARSELKRFEDLYVTGDATADAIDRSRQRVLALEESVRALEKERDALRRGPIPEEVLVARAVVEASRGDLLRAEAAASLATVTAPFGGVVLDLYKHAGDVLAREERMAVLRMADTTRLRVRMEVPEGQVRHVCEGLEGTFEPLGGAGEHGRLVVRTILPAFAPRRLFDPDTSARVDARALDVLGEIVEACPHTYSGQRVDVRLPLKRGE